MKRKKMFNEKEYQREYWHKNRERLLVHKREYYKSHKEDLRLRAAWRGMHHRCNDERYRKHYGSKGITVCDEWSDFDVFKKWSLENGYDKALTLDRINNNLGYSPDNCRWATRTVQQRNRDCNVAITFGGVTRCLSEWAEVTGISAYALRHRIARNWDIERALTTKTRKYKKESV